MTRPLGEGKLTGGPPQEESTALTHPEKLFQSTPFIGREKELQRIAAHLADPECRLLTLIGPGGIGKTRLAYQASEELENAFADGVHFIPLAPLASADFLIFTDRECVEDPLLRP